MARTTKHPRKSGATTIKKDGKIVGNIGRGKDTIPTAGKTKPPTALSKTVKETNTTTLTSSPTTITNTHMTFKSLQILWNMINENKISERLHIFSNCISVMNSEDTWKSINMFKKYSSELTSEESEQLGKLLNSEQLSEKFYTSIIQYGNPWHIGRIASNPNIPEHAIDLMISKHGHMPSLWGAICQNDDISLHRLEQAYVGLKKIQKQRGWNISEDYLIQEVFRLLSSHKKMSGELLDKLAKDNIFKDVQENIAFNSNTFPTTLTLLYNENKYVDEYSRDYYFVSFRLAQNKNTPLNILEELRCHSDQTIVDEVLENPTWKNHVGP